MQIARRPGYNDLFAQKPAQHSGDGWRFGVEQAGVADQGNLGPQFVSIVAQERHQRRRPRFLFTLEQEGKIAGQRPVNRFPGAAGLNECHQLSLVVA